MMRAATIVRYVQSFSHCAVRNGRGYVRGVRPLSSDATAVSAAEPKEHKPLPKGPGLRDFLVAGKNIPAHTAIENVPYLDSLDYSGHGRKVFFDVYGCQMNVNDTEIVWAILRENGFAKTDTITDANVVLVVTCAIREGAEDKVCFSMADRC